MSDSRRERALTAARIRLRSPVPRPLLDETRIDEVCAELLAMDATIQSLTADADAVLDWLEGKAATSPETALPATIDPEGGPRHG